MGEVNPKKEIFLLGSLKVVLPTFDVYSDVALSTKLYVNGLPIWGTLLLGPVLINYALCWFAWLTMEKKKKFTWIAALLGCYPQLVAARIIWLFWTQPLKGVREKKHLERNLMGSEIFTEAVPSILAMTFLMMASMQTATHDGKEHVIFGQSRSSDFYLFFVTFFTSALSACLGLAKCLKVGACWTSSNNIMMVIQS